MVGRGVLNPDVSTGAVPGFLGEELAPGRKGAAILIVWLERARRSSGGVRRVPAHWRGQRHALLPLQQGFLRPFASLGEARRLADFLPFQPDTPHTLGAPSGEPGPGI